jgi:hypothetical protein
MRVWSHVKKHFDDEERAQMNVAFEAAKQEPSVALTRADPIAARSWKC